MINRINEINSKTINAAIENGELSLHYQMQTSVTSNKIVGMEALVRWQSPRFGQVDTSKFIDVLEHSGIDLIAKFHKWVLDRAFNQIQRWREIGICVPIFINFSTRYLQREECLTLIKTLLQKYDLPTSCFGVEVTESSEIMDMSSIQYVLESLHQMGIEIALDDFCTSFCSLEYLTKIPATKIKIDKQFIQNLGSIASQPQTSFSIIVESIIDMANRLGVEVIAEGVETIEQLEHITYLGCDSYQGYLNYPPVPPSYIPPILLNFQYSQPYPYSFNQFIPPVEAIAKPVSTFNFFD